MLAVLVVAVAAAVELSAGIAGQVVVGRVFAVLAVEAAELAVAEQAADIGGLVVAGRAVAELFADIAEPAVEGFAAGTWAVEGLADI